MGQSVDINKIVKYDIIKHNENIAYEIQLRYVTQRNITYVT